MRSRFVVIAKITFQYPAQMLLAEHNHVIQALATYASNHPLGVWILPWVQQSARPQCPFPELFFESIHHRCRHDLGEDNVPLHPQETLRLSVARSMPPSDVR